MQWLKSKMIGFSLLEVTLVVAIFMVLLTATGMSLSSFFSSRQLETYSEEVLQSLRQAQAYAMARYEDSAWGVYFDEPKSTWTLFKGNNFATRDPALDELTTLPASLSFKNRAFHNGGSEIDFKKISGETGYVESVTLHETGGKNVIFNINPYGQIEME